MIKNIKKRNGETVEFDPNKIGIALTKAFDSAIGKINPAEIAALADIILKRLEATAGENTPSVELVQDIAEQTLMTQGHYSVAKAYIVYRHEHAKLRVKKQQEAQIKIETTGLMITKRDGRKELFSLDKVKRSIGYAIAGYESIIDANAIAQQVRAEIYEDISTKDIARSVIMVLRQYIELDPAYSYAAARALLTENYKEVIGHDKIDFSKLEAQLRQAFITNIKEGVIIGKLDPRMLTFDLEALSLALDFSRDKQHTYLSAQTLEDRYVLRKDVKCPAMECLQSFWMRNAMGVALNEEKRDYWALKFYEEMSTLRYIPSTPTMFHSGTNHPQLSSCYITTVEDDLTHIFKCVGDNAQLAKWSGGIGNDWTNLRGTGALIKGTGVTSQGIIPFLKIANDGTAAINRSGRRRGASCSYLETWHWDIEDFLELRKNTGDERRRTHDMDTANWIPDLFMKRVKDNTEWSLFSPQETPDLHHLFGKAFEERYAYYEQLGREGKLEQFRTVKAADLWKKMLTMLFETGHPWITWKDACNVRSPQDHVGVVHSSNLCTEITLNTSADETAVCNLGSVNLNLLLKDNKLDVAQLAETITIAMRMLDNVIDINFYPTIEAERSNKRHRPVGLGIRGFQDTLYLMDIPFESEEAVRFADQSMEVISYYAILGSSRLAKERGTYASYKGSKWDRGIFPLDTMALLEQERGLKIDVDRSSQMDWSVVRESVKQYGMRNSNTMAIAPTATTANIAGFTPSIEPLFKNIFVKSNQAGDFTAMNPYLVEDLKKLNLWDADMLNQIKFNDGKLANIATIPQALKDKYKEVFEMDALKLVKVTAYRGKWIDQSQSFNVFYSGRSGKDISDIYLYAWDMGLKTTYYLRTMGMSQVEKSTVSTEKFGDTHKRNNGPAPVTPAAMPAGTFTMPNLVAGELVTSHQSPVTGVNTDAGTTQNSIPINPVPSTSSSLSLGVEDQSQAPNPSFLTGDMPKLCRLDDPECESCGG